MVSLQESLLKNVRQDDDSVVRSKIETWLKTYTDIKNTRKFTINDDFTIDAPDVCISEVFDEPEIPDYIQFRNIERDFSIRSESLTSLRGFPIYVGRDLSCEYQKITSLKYAPKTVGRSANFSYCKHLKTLDGCPNANILDFNHCESLKTLDGIGNVTDYLNISHCFNLRSLNGLKKIKEIGGFGAVCCYKLQSLKNLPKLSWECDLKGCTHIKSLEGLRTRNPGMEMKIDIRHTAISGPNNIVPFLPPKVGPFYFDADLLANHGYDKLIGKNSKTQFGEWDTSVDTWTTYILKKQWEWPIQKYELYIE